VLEFLAKSSNYKASHIAIMVPFNGAKIGTRSKYEKVILVMWKWGTFTHFRGEKKRWSF